MFAKEFREINKRTAREEKTPLVVYDRGGSHGTAHLANIRDYLLTIGTWPPDYSKARLVEADDLPLITEAQRLVREAGKAAEKLYAIAFTRGLPITAEAAEEAEKAVQQ